MKIDNKKPASGHFPVSINSHGFVPAGVFDFQAFLRYTERVFLFSPAFGLGRRGRFSFAYRYLPVTLPGFWAISSGEPAATIFPPASPPPGPMSMT